VREVLKLSNLTGELASLHSLEEFSGEWHEGLHEGLHRSVRATLEITRTRAAIEASNLAQGTLGWVAGCAWTDVATNLFPTLTAPPDFFVLLANTACAPGLSAIAVIWLAVSGDDPTKVPWNEVMHRDDVEQYFLTGAMSFFVGWAWVLVIRDVFVPFGAAITAVGALVARLFNLPFDAATVRWASELACVLVFAPLLTAAFFVSKSRIREAYRRAVGLRANRKWKFAASASVSNPKLRGLAARSTMTAVVQRAASQSSLDLSSLHATRLLADQEDHLVSC